MAEDPIKLFATRAERYPEPTDADIAQGAARAALAAIPFVGGSITEILSLVLAPAVSRRRDTWLKELADALEQAERKIDGFKIGNLAQDEAFVSAVIEATRSAISTHNQEKRQALRNAVLNTALMRSVDEDKQTVFLSLIDVLSVIHLSLLRFFSNRGGYSSEHGRRLIERRSLTDPMIIELLNRGLLRDPRPSVSRTRDSEDSLILHQWTPTSLGTELLVFVSTPELLK